MSFKSKAVLEQSMGCLPTRIDILRSFIERLETPRREAEKKDQDRLRITLTVAESKFLEEIFYDQIGRLEVDYYGWNY